MKIKLIPVLGLLLGASAPPLLAQHASKSPEALPAEDAAELAKKLSNPVAAYVEGPTGTPEWSMRFVVTFLLPK